MTDLERLMLEAELVDVGEGRPRTNEEAAQIAAAVAVTYFDQIRTLKETGGA
jgi:hypothetical protein